MKKLVVARHGNYESDLSLSDSGREQMRRLAEALKSVVEGKRALILTSTAVRASQSALLLGGILSINVEHHEILLSEGEEILNLNAVIKLVREKDKSGVDVLILVTHREYANCFPAFFSEKELDLRLHYRDIKEGEACVIDCEQKMAINLRP